MNSDEEKAQLKADIDRLFPDMDLEEFDMMLARYGAAELERHIAARQRCMNNHPAATG
jgi:hypothetical protein